MPSASLAQRLFRRGSQRANRFAARPAVVMVNPISFQFHYFPLRKMHFILRAKAIAVFPGGFGTLDELFDVLTLMQTGKMPIVLVLLSNREFWDQIISFEALIRAGMIERRDLGLFRFVSSTEEAWATVQTFYVEHPVPRWHGGRPDRDER